MQPLPVRVDLEAMAIKEYSAFFTAPALLVHQHQIASYYIQKTRWGGESYPFAVKLSEYSNLVMATKMTYNAP